MARDLKSLSTINPQKSIYGFQRNGSVKYKLKGNTLNTPNTPVKVLL